MRTVAVVGASLAGLSAADALRTAGYDGDLVVVDPSSELPPDRPPLSKKVLAGTMAPGDAGQPAAHRLGELDLDLRLGVAATGLDVTTHDVRLSDGSILPTDGVVIASGSSPRRLDTALDGVHVLRDLDQCLAIRADLDRSPRRVVVVGAGFIGAEVAATCRQRGLEVTMIEAQDRPMQRVLPGGIGDFFTEIHRGEGVD